MSNKFMYHEMKVKWSQSRYGRRASVFLMNKTSVISQSHMVQGTFFYEQYDFEPFYSRAMAHNWSLVVQHAPSNYLIFMFEKVGKRNK